MTNGNGKKPLQTTHGRRAPEKWPAEKAMKDLVQKARRVQREHADRKKENHELTTLRDELRAAFRRCGNLKVAVELKTEYDHVCDLILVMEDD